MKNKKINIFFILFLIFILFLNSCQYKRDNNLKISDNGYALIDDENNETENNHIEKNKDNLNRENVTNDINNNILSSNNLNETNDIDLEQNEENKSENNQININETPKPKLINYNNEKQSEENITINTTSQEKQKETLNINITTFYEYKNWYMCKGACIFGCKERNSDFSFSDIEENGYCVCLCNNNVQFSTDYENIEINILEDKDILTIEYIKK